MKVVPNKNMHFLGNIIKQYQWHHKSENPDRSDAPNNRTNKLRAFEASATYIISI